MHRVIRRPNHSPLHLRQCLMQDLDPGCSRQRHPSVFVGNPEKKVFTGDQNTRQVRYSNGEIAEFGIQAMALN